MSKRSRIIPFSPNHYRCFIHHESLSDGRVKVYGRRGRRLWAPRAYTLRLSGEPNNRLKQARDRSAKVRRIQEAFEAFVVEYAAQSNERPSLIVQTLLRYAFEALVVQTGNFANARIITQGIVEIGYLKHKYKSH